MKSVFKGHIEVKFPGEDWIQTGQYHQWVYKPKVSQFVFNGILDTFDDLFDAAMASKLGSGLKFNFSLTGKRRSVTYGDYVGHNYICITSKNFAPVKYRAVYTEVENPTMKDLFEKLSADDFIECCKDNGLMVCPIQEDKK